MKNNYLIYYKIKNIKKYDIIINFLNNNFLNIKNKIKNIKCLKLVNKKKILIKLKNISNNYQKINLTLNFNFYNFINIFNPIKIILYIDKKIILNIFENYELLKFNIFINKSILILKIKEKSTVIYIKYKNKKIYSINKLIILQESKSKFNLYDINLFEKFSLNKIKIYNLNNGCKTNIKGIYILNNNQNLNNNIIIKNNYNNCKTKQKFLGIYDNRSQIYLKGEVFIKKTTIGNNSSQLYTNFILSNFVKLNIKPYLNIFTHKVKCNHGVNIGTIDNNIIFYLLTRGLNLYKSKILYFYTILSNYIKNSLILNLIKTKIIVKLKKCLIKKR
ncbi:MAG: SufD family Fe-S cluster assembly protein [Candidatus Shikimatogenerans sp. JK-2022]|nr:SufD family Fe-S cluster assembly protein [Candidatus Shikimatogenerans bostrichidophilus]